MAGEGSLTDRDVKEIVVPADLGEVDRVRKFLRDFLGGLGVDEDAALRIELALHEICVNIAMYAYPKGRRGNLAVRLWREDGRFTMEFRDSGVPFDPGRKPAPDLLEKVRRGHRGGYGVYLFKTLMDGFRYERDGDENVLTVFKNT